MTEPIRHTATAMQRYERPAFAVMANHVHLLITPNQALPTILKSLKNVTARRANALLARSGQSFWPVESFDNLLRDHWEFDAIRSYIEENPVRAMPVGRTEDYRWSSASRRGATAQV